MPVIRLDPDRPCQICKKPQRPMRLLAGYGPPDPVPAWQAQLEALEIEASRRTGSSFAELDIPGRRELIRRQELDGGSGLPSPLRARHVAVALMAHWFGSSEAVDRCYGRRIAERTCRGIDSAASEPEAV